MIDNDILCNLYNQVCEIDYICRDNRMRYGYSLFYDPDRMILAFVIDPQFQGPRCYNLAGCQILAQGDPIEVGNAIMLVSTVIKFQAGMIGGWS